MGRGVTCTACGEPLEAGQQFCARCGTPAPALPADPLRARLQELLGTELELLDIVGRGGMAVVYVARDPLLERKVAIKAMLPEFATDAEMADRFLREARTSAQLQHPNIVSVFGARSRGDLLVMLMAFVEGRSLDAVLHEQGKLPLRVAGRLGADVASALQYAHEHKVIHRDVKPANVLLASNGGALVSDFGIARRQDVPGLTGEGMLLGSLAYMSPEQRMTQPLTGATDQYALGVSMFEMLAGRGPFTGPPIEQHLAHLNEPAPSVREFRPEVPDDVARCIAKMLAKEPDKRYPDLREPKRIFERMVTDARSVSAEIAQLSGVLAAPSASRVISAVRKALTLPIEIPTQRAAAAAPSSAPTVAMPATPAPTAAPRESRRVLYAAVAGAVLIIAGAVMLKSKLTQQAAPNAPPVAAQVAGSSQPAVEAPAAEPSTSTPSGATPSRTAPSAALASGAAASGAAVHGPQASITPSPLATSGAATPGVPLPNATLRSRGAEAPAAAPSAPAVAPAEPVRAAPSEPAPVKEDARAAARALLTMMNQRLARDLERLPDAGGGDAAARKALEKLIRDHDDFEAGFDRMASEPEADGAVFVTEFVVDASWRSGGKDQGALFDVRLRLRRQGDAWVPAAYSVRAR